MYPSSEHATAALVISVLFDIIIKTLVFGTITALLTGRTAVLVSGACAEPVFVQGVSLQSCSERLVNAQGLILAAHLSSHACRQYAAKSIEVSERHRLIVAVLQGWSWQQAQVVCRSRPPSFGGPRS